MILEAIVTTLNSDGTINIAPMGPVVEDEAKGGLIFERFDLKPFETATTHANLLRSGCGVLHVTDDVELFALAALNRLDEASVTTIPASSVDGAILSNCCRFYEFNVEFADTSSPRATFKCRTVASGSRREFFGFNRARHAVLEAAILATRIAFIPVEVILRQFEDLRTIVAKTGGKNEIRAFETLEEYVRSTTEDDRSSNVAKNAGA
ncbi:MAG: DUF447 domain-containing protein [Planctomycetota bacterium]